MGRGVIYGSVCSGIEAASVAWHPLGWRAAFFSEIEPFPCAVLTHHCPTVPNYGDMTRFKEWPDANLDVLVGGTPCQSFSVAGLRKGLDDPRGNLTLVYLAIAAKYRPRWLVWENVPGVLSDATGAFGAFLGGLGQLGYGFAYRILDAQFFGVPQRRRRVFVVGHIGDWRRAAAVLLEPESLRGDSPPRREAGERIAGPIAGCSNGGGANGPGRTADDADSLIASTGDVSHCLNAGGMGRQDYETETLVSHSLRADGFDAGEDGTGRGTPLVPVAFTANDYGADAPISPTLRAGGHKNSHANAGVMPALHHGSAVRRLTPRECCRLQGFPDDYLDIQYRNKPAADGPRYKALGNSMAVPVMRWIGERIARVEQVELAVAA